MSRIHLPDSKNAQFSLCGAFSFGRSGPDAFRTEDPAKATCRRCVAKHRLATEPPTTVPREVAERLYQALCLFGDGHADECRAASGDEPCDPHCVLWAEALAAARAHGLGTPSPAPGRAIPADSSGADR